MAEQPNPFNIFQGYEVPAHILRQVDSAILATRRHIDRLELTLSVVPHLKRVKPWQGGSKQEAARAIVDSRLIRAFKAGDVLKVFDSYGRFYGWTRPRIKRTKVDGKWVKSC